MAKDAKEGAAPIVGPKEGRIVDPEQIARAELSALGWSLQRAAHDHERNPIDTACQAREKAERIRAELHHRKGTPEPAGEPPGRDWQEARRDAARDLGAAPGNPAARDEEGDQWPM